MKNFDYSSIQTPACYRCATCGATGVKLWREAYTDMPKLLCAVCAAKEEGMDISDIDATGHYTGKHNRTTIIGLYVPAIPMECTGYWSYHLAVPMVGRNWWHRLPTLPA